MPPFPQRRPEDDELEPVDNAAEEGAEPAPAEESTGNAENAGNAGNAEQGLGINQASPEAQAQYTKIVSKAMTLIYDEKMFPVLIEMLKGGQSDAGDEEGMGPAHGLANAAVKVLMRVKGAADEAGQDLDPTVMFHAGTEIFNQLADISARAGIKDYSQDPDAAEAAYFQAIQQVVDALKQSGQLDERQAAADMQRLAQSDHDGLLQQLMQKLNDNDNGGAPAEGGEPPQEPMRGGMGV